VTANASAKAAQLKTAFMRKLHSLPFQIRALRNGSADVWGGAAKESNPRRADALTARRPT